MHRVCRSSYLRGQGVKMSKLPFWETTIVKAHLVLLCRTYFKCWICQNCCLLCGEILYRGRQWWKTEPSVLSKISNHHVQIWTPSLPYIIHFMVIPMVSWIYSLSSEVSRIILVLNTHKVIHKARILIDNLWNNEWAWIPCRLDCSVCSSKFASAGQMNKSMQSTFFCGAYGTLKTLLSL